MLLHVIANPRPEEESRSRRVARAFLDGYRSANPDAEVREVDLFAEDLPMTDAKDINTRIHQFRGQELPPEEKERFDRFMRFIDPLLECERLVLTTPMWNFGPPWRLKQWFDTVTQARVTFQYTPQGPQGLTPCDRAAILGSRGGAYPEGDPRETSDFLVPYLTRALEWIGIGDVQTCFAEAIEAQRDRAEEILKETEEKARAMGEGF